MRFLPLLAMLILGACRSQPLVPPPSQTLDLGFAPALAAPPMPPSVEVVKASRPAPAVPATAERRVRPGVRAPCLPPRPVSCDRTAARARLCDVRDLFSKVCRPCVPPPCVGGT